MLDLFQRHHPSCSATGWTGAYQIGRGATSFNIPQPDPSGSQARIIQDTTYATQSFTVATSGLYTLTFYVANRSTGGFRGAQTLEVLLDNVVVSGGAYSSLPFSWTLETLDLDLNSGMNSLTFEGTIPGTVKDATAFVDDVSLVAAQTTASALEPSSLLLGGIAGAAALGMFVHRRKTARSLNPFRRVVVAIPNKKRLASFKREPPSSNPHPADNRCIGSNQTP
jgi:hypothetical protein